MLELPADRRPFIVRHQQLILTMAPLIILSLLPQELQAANPVNVTGSTDFAEIYGRLVGWIKGDLGRTLSISFVLIGLAYGMARNSLIGFATGVGAAVGLQVTPTIINSIFGL
ncbi:TraA family conjugative transfer protein [Endozoicomonas sp. 4G]|uniref:TraA family conjugative transfer protein n=1 Tax=Endozoicomonas sp. 4G TaxID=2872754 RepID=UPI002078C1A8|nr:TraA family conjugative transfer protein [Endozoicomonas sp. 4G]